jgi:predicted nucleotide-binding protein
VDVSRKVFVIHGRDEDLREAMFDLLRALSLQPLEWEQLVADHGAPLPFLYDVVAEALSEGRVQAVLVLLTPDDVVQLHPDLYGPNEPRYEREPALQPRPNVLIELGMALGTHRDRTVVVEVGGLRPIADLAGLNVIRFDGSDAAIGKIVCRLKLAGCQVEADGADWRRARRFAGLGAFERQVGESEPRR